MQSSPLKIIIRRPMTFESLLFSLLFTLSSSFSLLLSLSVLRSNHIMFAIARAYSLFLHFPLIFVPPVSEGVFLVVSHSFHLFHYVALYMFELTMNWMSHSLCFSLASSKQLYMSPVW